MLRQAHQTVRELPRPLDPGLPMNYGNLPHHLFGHGGAERAAQRLGVPFLGAIPLDQEIREEADHGAPVVWSRPASQAGKAFRDLASQVAAKTSIQSFRRLPVINVR